MLKIFLAALMATAYLTDVKAYNLVVQLPNFNETENLTVNENYDIEDRNSTNDNNTTEYFFIDFPRIGYEIFKNKMAQAMEIYESFMEKNPVIIKVERTDLFNNGTINLTLLNNNITEKNESLSDLEQILETSPEPPVFVNVTEIYENTTQTLSELSNNTQIHTNYSLPLLENSAKNKTANNETNNTTNNEENIAENYKINNTTSFAENTTTINEVNQTVSNEETKISSNDANMTITKQEKNPELAPVGFFGKVSDTVADIFHSLTSWF